MGVTPALLFSAELIWLSPRFIREPVNTKTQVRFLHYDYVASTNPLDKSEGDTGRMRRKTALGLAVVHAHYNRPHVVTLEAYFHGSQLLKYKYTYIGIL